MMRNVYGSALPARMALEKQILGRYSAYQASVKRQMWYCDGAHQAQVCSAEYKGYPGSSLQDLDWTLSVASLMSLNLTRT